MKKKIHGNRDPVGGGGSDPRGNISRITSARFVGEILITFPRHQDGESLRLINIFARMDIIKYNSGRDWILVIP